MSNAKAILPFLLIPVLNLVGAPRSGTAISTPVARAKIQPATDFALSPDGSWLALVHASGYEGPPPYLTLVALHQRRQETIRSDDLWSFKEPFQVTALCWSSDGRFLAIELSDYDVYAVVRVADLSNTPPTLQSIKLGAIGTSSMPHWSPDRHLLYIVPVSVDLGDSRDSGIGMFDADKGSVKRILLNYFVLGKHFDVGTDSVVAMVKPAGQSAEIVVRYSLTNGSTTIVSPAESARPYVKKPGSDARPK